MKILIFEYITGGGMRKQSLPAALAREGEAMLAALLQDLQATPDWRQGRLELSLLRDDRLPPCAPAEAGLKPVWVGAGADFAALWQAQLCACDALWPIAPETGGILENLCLEAEQAGKLLLSSPAAAVRLAADKLACLRRLEAYGLPVVPSVSWQAGEAPPQVLAGSLRYVIKPRDGVGCAGICISDDPAGFEPGEAAQEWIMQPLIEGEALSLSLLCAQGEARLLSVNRQWIAQTETGFFLQGCEVNALADTGGVWSALGAAIAHAAPELWGYVGVDLLLSTEGPRILEINPRLTTSYAGLHAALAANPAAWVLDLAQTGTLPPRREVLGRPVAIRLEQHL
jgi:predicted ATP-grasp superfamily ATP-dependent carboligase